MRKQGKHRLSLVNHGVRHHEKEVSSIWFCIWGRTRIFLDPRLSEPRVSHSKAQISVWEWSLNLVFLFSLNGYHYKQERERDMFRKLHSMKVGESC
jgi:hypothetical protein